MSKIIERAFPLFFVFLGLYQVFGNQTDLDISQVLVRLAIIPFALVFFTLTFMKGGSSQKLVAIVMLLLGLSLALGGFGLFLMGHHGCVIIGVAGVIFMASSFRMLFLAFHTTTT